MIVGFDYDGTLNSPTAKKFFSKMSDNLNQCELLIITNRFDVDDEMVETIKEIGLSEVLVYSLGETDYKSKAEFVADEELEIDVFFENDDREIELLKQIGISCFKVEEA